MQNNSLDGCWTSPDGNNEFKELFKNICLGLVLGAACLLTIVGNVLVLHAVRTERKLQTVRYVAQLLLIIRMQFVCEVCIAPRGKPSQSYYGASLAI